MFYALIVAYYSHFSTLIFSMYLRDLCMENGAALFFFNVCIILPYVVRHDFTNHYLIMFSLWWVSSILYSKNAKIKFLFIFIYFLILT